MADLNEAELEEFEALTNNTILDPLSAGQALALGQRLLTEVRRRRKEESRTVHTTNTVAKMLSYSEEHTRAMCEQGRFPGAYRASEGGHWRIPQGAVDAFREACAPKIRRRVGG